jgi:hypothetical protein
MSNCTLKARIKISLKLVNTFQYNYRTISYSFAASILLVQNVLAVCDPFLDNEQRESQAAGKSACNFSAGRLLVYFMYMSEGTATKLELIVNFSKALHSLANC